MNTKICERCGVEFHRPKQTTSYRWDTRRYCNQRCHIAKPSDDAPRQSAEEISCGKLLRSLVSYGLRHDGLPGMPAERLLSVAAELGVGA